MTFITNIFNTVMTLKNVRRNFSFLLLAALLIASTDVTLAQHETGSDLLNGESAFQDYCANCHGPDGDLINEVDLGHNNFRQPYSDAALVGIIMNGIPDTPMPPTPRVSEEQALMVVAYLRSLGEDDASKLAGNKDAGKVLFDGKGECLTCHMVNGVGAVLAPDLSSIALIRSAAQLQRSLLEPDSEVQADSRFYTVRTRNGQSVSGRLLNHDAFSIQMLDKNQRLRAFEKSALQSFGFIDPGMPSLADDFSGQEIADIVAYLASLRRGAAQ